MRSVRPGEVAAAVGVGVQERLDVEAVDDRVLPPEVAGGLGPHAQRREHALPEGVDERLELLADVVEVDRVEAERGELLQPGDVLLEVGRDEHAAAHVLGAHEARGLVELPRPSAGPTGAAAGTGWCATGRRRCRAPAARPAPTTGGPGGTPACPRRRRRGRRRATRSSCSRGWLIVTSPSAHSPAQPAVAALTAAPISFGGCAGSVHSRARSTVTSPSWSTTSPANSARMTSTHSRRRALRVALSGHGSPVMCSLDASPVPSATQKRPGYISASVAAAWAMIAGW